MPATTSAGALDVGVGGTWADATTERKKMREVHGVLNLNMAFSNGPKIWK
jgi:hypothetical protein